jgi:hypothetical protein
MSPRKSSAISPRKTGIVSTGVSMSGGKRSSRGSALPHDKDPSNEEKEGSKVDGSKESPLPSYLLTSSLELNKGPLTVPGSTSASAPLTVLPPKELTCSLPLELSKPSCDPSETSKASTPSERSEGGGRRVSHLDGVLSTLRAAATASAELRTQLKLTKRAAGVKQEVCELCGSRSVARGEGADEGGSSRGGNGDGGDEVYVRAIVDAANGRAFPSMQSPPQDGTRSSKSQCDLEEPAPLEGDGPNLAPASDGGGATSVYSSPMPSTPAQNAPAHDTVPAHSSRASVTSPAPLADTNLLSHLGADAKGWWEEEPLPDPTPPPGGRSNGRPQHSTSSTRLTGEAATRTLKRQHQSQLNALRVR